MMNCNPLVKQQLMQPEVIKASKQFHKYVEHLSFFPLSTSLKRFLKIQLHSLVQVNSLMDNDDPPYLSSSDMNGIAAEKQIECAELEFQSYKGLMVAELPGLK